MARCTDDAELGQQRLGERAGGDARRGLAGAGALEHVAGVVEAVLLHAGEVGVAGPGLGQRLLRWRPARATSPRTHFGHSVLPISIATGEPSVRPWRTPAEEPDLVLLEPHPGPAAVAEAAAGQLGADVFDRDRQPGGQALDDDDERLAVGLAGGQEAQHPSMVPASHRSLGRVLS